MNTTKRLIHPFPGRRFPRRGITHIATALGIAADLMNVESFTSSLVGPDYVPQRLQAYVHRRSSLMVQRRSLSFQ